MQLNITDVILEQKADPCSYVTRFNEKLELNFKYAFFTIIIIQIIQFILIDRYLKRYKRGEITNPDQFYILFTTFAIMQYVQGIFFLFMLFTTTGLFIA